MTQADTLLRRPLFRGPAQVSARATLWEQNDLPAYPPPRLPFMYTPMHEIVHAVSQALHIADVKTRVSPAMSYTLVTWWQDVRALALPPPVAHKTDRWAQRVPAWWRTINPISPRFALWEAVVHEWKSVAENPQDLRAAMTAAAHQLDQSAHFNSVKAEDVTAALRPAAPLTQDTAGARAATDARLRDIFPLGPDIVQRSGPAVKKDNKASPYTRALHEASSKGGNQQAAALLSGILRRPMIHGSENRSVVPSYPLLMQLKSAEKRAVTNRLALDAMENVYDEFAAVGWGLASLVIELLRHLELVDENYEEHKYMLRVPRIASDKEFSTVDATRNLAFTLRDVLDASYVPQADVENPDTAKDMTQKFDKWVLRPVLQQQSEALKVESNGTPPSLEASAHRYLGLGQDDGPYAAVEKLLKAVRRSGATHSWLSIPLKSRSIKGITDLNVRELEVTLGLDAYTLDRQAVERAAAMLWSQAWFQRHVNLRSARALRYFIQEVVDWEDRKAWMETLNRDTSPDVDAPAPGAPTVVEMEYEGAKRVTRIIGLKSNIPGALEYMKRLAAGQFHGAEVYVAEVNM
jgi:hypothetical protein